MTDEDGAWQLRAKLTARQQRWLDKLSQVEPRLKLSELAARLGEPYATVQRWASFFGYPIRDGRSERPARVDWSRVNWRKSNVVIARELSVSRERVRQVRATRETEEAARGVLPNVEVASFQRNDGKPGFDWRLPNRDLAEIHRMSVQQVANLRFRLSAGAAQWDARGGRSLTGRDYLAARKKEERKARNLLSNPTKKNTAGRPSGQVPQPAKDRKKTVGAAVKKSPRHRHGL